MALGPDLTLAIDLLQWGTQPLYRDFALSVPPGQTVALIGPSGVGKTTLLRLLAGIERGFTGTALVGGEAAMAAPVPGLVFQDARLLPWLTVEANLRAVCPDLTPEKAEEALASVGLSGSAGAWPRQLSGGMQRRVGLARALLVNPRLLLLDEPFASLDREVTRDLQRLLVRLIAQSEATAVLVSHDPSDAAHLAQRVILLSGRPVQIKADFTLPGTPATRRTADITACEAMIDSAKNNLDA